MDASARRSARASGDRGVPDRQFILSMGSFHEWHPASVLVYRWVFEAVIRLGFKVRVIEKACRAINLNGSLASARDGMRRAGVELV